MSPVIAFLIGWALSGEPFGWRQLALAAIMLAAAALAVLPARDSRAA